MCSNDNFLSPIFLFVSLKFRACYITGEWGEVRVKNATLYLHIPFWLFLLLLLLLFSFKTLCFHHFHFFFFAEVSNFRNRILPNQKPGLMVRKCQWNYVLLPTYYSRHLIEGEDIFSKSSCSTESACRHFHFLPGRLFEGIFDRNFMLWTLWTQWTGFYIIGTSVIKELNR